MEQKKRNQYAKDFSFTLYHTLSNFSIGGSLWEIALYFTNHFMKELKN